MPLHYKPAGAAARKMLQALAGVYLIVLVTGLVNQIHLMLNQLYQNFPNLRLITLFLNLCNMSYVHNHGYRGTLMHQHILL